MALGYENATKAVRDHCRIDGGLKRYPIVDALGRAQEAVFISEGDVYRLIAHSKLPTAERFERWLFDEVLPSIRKHGAYLTPETIEQVLSDPDTIIQLATNLKAERLQRRAPEVELDRNKEWYSIKRVAALNQVSFKIFEWRKLKAASAALGHSVKKIFDANYGEVNTYHQSAWEAVYPRYEL